MRLSVWALVLGLVAGLSSSCGAGSYVKGVGRVSLPGGTAVNLPRRNLHSEGHDIPVGLRPAVAKRFRVPSSGVKPFAAESRGRKGFFLARACSTECGYVDGAFSHDLGSLQLVSTFGSPTATEFSTLPPAGSHGIVLGSLAHGALVGLVGFVDPSVSAVQIVGHGKILDSVVPGSRGAFVLISEAQAQLRLMSQGDVVFVTNLNPSSVDSRRHRSIRCTQLPNS